MIVKYNRLGYLIGEGLSNVFKNKKSTGASLMIMCATMIIFGIFLILGENINHFVEQVESAQGIQVFVKNEATQEQIDELVRTGKIVDDKFEISDEPTLSKLREEAKTLKIKGYTKMTKEELESAIKESEDKKIG